MSSIVGHLLAGSACHLTLSTSNTVRAPARWLAAMCLAIVPDLDYLPAWWWHIDMSPRYSHSIGFCLLLGLAAWGLLRHRTSLASDQHLLALCLLSPLSHLLLDLLVGVQAKPVLWPLTAEPLVLPFGILPSAGQLDWRNAILWRNLLIETGVLLPAAMLLVGLTQRSWRIPVWLYSAASGCGIACGYWAYGLAR